MIRAIRMFALAAAAGAALASPAAGQDHIESKVEIPFNRYYTVEEIEGHLRAIAAAYPELVELRSIGKSLEGRDLWVAIVNNPRTGPHESKPAMWIDGNIHGNELQASEVVLYTLWYLTKAYGKNPALTDLLDRYSFYLMPSVNPDGRAAWFAGPSTPHSSRSNARPVDNDGDGLIDEDSPDDLDGDGSITQMWREDPNGRWVRSQTDPRVFIELRPDERPLPGVTAYTRERSEGIDNDGDGRINEDGPGGDDMNRNWPSGWQPNHVQWGAGPYPLSEPESRAIAEFILAHPNIAAVQSYHNTGGMILRGPGAAFREGMYPGADARVYDEIARVGEQMLPYYRSMVIHRDLYTVHGGFVNWTAEGLGIVSFTNELWNAGKYFQRTADRPSEEQMSLFRERLQFGQAFKDYTEVEHPTFGRVLVGGLNKWASRTTPTFMLEEECHRNFAFTMFHAGEMPVLRFDRVEVAPVGEGGGLWSVTASVRNDRLIPTRLLHAQRSRIGRHDLMECRGAEVVAGGRLADWFRVQMEPVTHEPGRLQVSEGIPGRGERIFRFFVRGKRGDKVVLRYDAEKARVIEREVVLE